jgi:hypothetical protein
MFYKKKISYLPLNLFLCPFLVTSLGYDPWYHPSPTYTLSAFAVVQNMHDSIRPTVSFTVANKAQWTDPTSATIPPSSFLMTQKETLHMGRKISSVHFHSHHEVLGRGGGVLA